MDPKRPPDQIGDAPLPNRRVIPTADNVDPERSKVHGLTQEKVANLLTDKGKTLNREQQTQLLSTLQSRFVINKKLHQKTEWSLVEKALLAAPAKTLWSLQQLEETGGEPDVFLDTEGEFIFGDCSKESPFGRRDVAYDKEFEEMFKRENPGVICHGNAVDKAAEWGTDLMEEAEWRVIQKSIKLDRNSWSWLKTPENIRAAGRAMDGGRGFWGEVYTRQYDQPTSNPLRGFRCVLKIKKVA